MSQLCCPNTIVLTVTNNMTTANGTVSKKGLHILHFNINSLLPKIDEFCFILKHSNVSTIGIYESKLDSSILNSEEEIVSCDAIRMDYSRRTDNLHVILKTHHCTKNEILHYRFLQ